MKKRLFIFIFLNLPLFLRADLPNDPVEYAAWEQDMLAGVERRKESPPEIAIPKLGSLVAQLSQGTNIEHGTRPVFHAAQSTLLAIPGHGKYYQDRIERTREAVKQYEALPDEGKRRVEREFLEQGRDIVQFYYYDGVRGDAFDILVFCRRNVYTFTPPFAFCGWCIPD